MSKFKPLTKGKDTPLSADDVTDEMVTSVTEGRKTSDSKPAFPPLESKSGMRISTVLRMYRSLVHAINGIKGSDSEPKFKPLQHGLDIPTNVDKDGKLTYAPLHLEKYLAESKLSPKTNDKNNDYEIPISDARPLKKRTGVRENVRKVTRRASDAIKDIIGSSKPKFKPLKKGLDVPMNVDKDGKPTYMPLHLEKYLAESKLSPKTADE